MSVKKLPDTAYWKDRQDPLAAVHGMKKVERKEKENMALSLLAAMPKLQDDPLLLARKVARFEQSVGGKVAAEEYLRIARLRVIEWTAPE